MLAAQLVDGARRRTQALPAVAHDIVDLFLYALRERLGFSAHGFLFGAPYQNIRQARIRRVPEHLAFRQLISKKTLAIVMRSRTNGHCVVHIGLHEHAALEAPAARTARDLLHQVERAFRRSEIGQAQLRVGIDHAHEHDIVEIEALRDHLRAQKHCRTGLAEFGEQLFMRIARRSGVGIHAHHANSRLASCARVVVKYASQLHFNTLRSRAELLQIGASAHRARHGRLGGFAAMVAHELAAHFVIGQRNRARSAFGHIAAIAAQQEVREPTLVQHEHDFTARIDRGEQVILQLFGKHGTRAAAEFLRHIENAHLGHGLAVRARRKHHAMPHVVDLATAQRLD